MQIIPMLFEEARRKGKLRWAAMDCLVRELREVFQNGWGKLYEPQYRSLLTEEQKRQIALQSEAEKLRFQRTHAFSRWMTDVLHVPANIERRLEAVARSLERLSPPIGWLPDGPDDPFIVAAFDEAWPESADVEYLPVGPHALCPKCGGVLIPPAEIELSQTCPLCGTEFPLFRCPGVSNGG